MYYCIIIQYYKVAFNDLLCQKVIKVNVNGLAKLLYDFLCQGLSW